MRIVSVLLLACLSFFSANAQVSGKIKDGQSALQGATVSMIKSKDSSVVKLAVTAQDGSFVFPQVKEGDYRVTASHVGYKTTYSQPFTVSASAVSLPDLILNKVSTGMADIVVTAKKPMVEVKADRTIMNVEGTINATGSDALDLLRKSPGVVVDKDENLTMSGKTGVQVYIDGRPTPLSGTDLSSYLKTLQSSQIESIELITNPSAKYEAAGNAGIINIKLKKNKSFGTNGSVNAGWNIGTYAKYNAGVSLNYRNKNVNIFGNYSYNKGINEMILGINRAVADSVFDQHGVINMNNVSHNYKVGVDYTLDKKSILGVMVNGTLSDPSVANNSRTIISNQTTGVVNRILEANNTSSLKRNNINANLNYTYNGNAGRSLQVNADYGNYNINTDQYQPNIYYDASGKNMLSSVIYQMVAPTTIQISSLKADYEQSFAKGKLGYGGKVAYVTTDNDFQRYNVYTSGKVLDQDRSNRFNYKENINAGYVNYNRALKGVIIQAGLRLENTNLKGISSGQKNGSSGYKPYDSTFTRNYTDLFPSAAVTFNKNPMSQLSITYSRRIDRPAYQDLNPFEFKLDEYTFQRGNINLRPQYTNSFGITHTYKYRLTTSLNFSHVKDLFTQIFDTAETTKAFISKRNLATQDIVSLNVSYPFQYKAYSFFGNLNTNYAHYNADFGTGRKIDLNSFGLSFFAQNSIKFAKTWTAEISGFYNAPTLYQGSLKAKALWSIDGGLQKQLMAGKATIKASVSDIFHTLRFTGTTDFAGQHSTVLSQWESRQFKLNFVYRFGSNQVKGARQKNSGAEEEMKRTQQSGGTPGIGQ